MLQKTKVNGVARPGRFSDDPARSWTLPASWYRASEIFDQEKDAIFFRSWWYAGPLSEVGEPGRYLTTTIIDQDVFVIRSADGTLRAFYNVCRHRAHRLLEGTGRCGRIVCPYHGWSYETNGAFLTGRGVCGIDGFDPAASGLIPVRVETMLGLVFVNLDDKARPLEETAQGMLADLNAHCANLDELTHVKRHQVVSNANWKVLVDNDLESYHVNSAHPALNELLDYRSFKVWEYDYATCHSMAGGDEDNSAYAIEEDAAVKTAIYTWLWPNTAFFVSPGRSNLAVFHMVPTGPESSVQIWDFFFKSAELSESEQAALDYTIDILIPEDSTLYENVQRGLRSRGYSEGRFVVNHDKPEWSEHHVHMFQKLVRDALVPGSDS
ncbi:MAG: aromatic ring-hydroxylating dioxygenase subunit alpha [Alphaproteobacteria bacterium]|nr:aromatic ring-hydroxylating dioxygenase subunit alpha [Alphaproteobacteria bacterium]